ncbi:MAG: hypothetical protein GWN14_07125 [candidate division Zixibacteria bacterium]|nr:hypothetical protein [Gammaproteobacteria bacterium]NIX55696.1 hypothetical protein [candidate division Zixibacteria bacterium]
MVVKDGYKLTSYTGWERQKDQDPIVELYQIEDDPEEMNNLATVLPEIKDALLNEVSDQAYQASQLAGPGK